MDKALAEVDGDGPQAPKPAAVAAPVPAPAPVSAPPKAAAAAPEVGAAGWKEKGNAHFKKGAYGAARDCYSRSLELAPTAIAFANRAMAALKEGLLAEAEADCTRALELDPMYLKAYQRRGAARKGLGRPLPAAQDYEEALRLEPTSKALRAERQACLALLQVKENLQPLAGRREVVVAGSLSGDAAAGAGDVPGAGAGTASSGEGPGSAPPPAMPASAAGEDGASADRGSSPGGGAAPSPRATAPVSVPRIAQKVPHTAPRTSTEFETAWKATAGDPRARVQLLGLVDAGSLAVLFKSSLTPQLLEGLLGTLLEDMLGQGVALTEAGGELVEALPGVPRFDMTAMCLPGKQRAALGLKWDAALARLREGSGSDLAGRLDKLRKKFRV